jgi:Na+/H+-dicarboxylate symporter
MNFINLNPFKVAYLGTQAVRDLAKDLDQFVKGQLWAKILFSLTLGILGGIVLGPDFKLIDPDISLSLAHWVAFPGEIFLALIKLVVIPLVFASVVLGIIGGDSLQRLKSLGIKTLIFYVLTTLIAVILGFVVAYTIQPGQYLDSSNLKILENTPPPLLKTGEIQQEKNIVSNLIPANPFSALVAGEMLQIVLLAIFLGIALMSLSKAEAAPLIALLKTFQKLSMVVIGWAMKLAPLAVFGLTFKIVSQLGMEALLGLGVYVLTVVAGLIGLFAIYLLLVQTIGQTSVFKFLKETKEVLLLAFSTSSSASVMPLTIETAETKLNVRKSISQFVIPLGTTVNMGGTALYQGVATAFLAQVFKIDLSLSQISLVVITATISSIGAPGTPGVGMAVLATILSSVGIPSSGVILIIGVDRFLDMCRTILNVAGDLSAAVILDKLESSEI